MIHEIMRQLESVTNNNKKSMTFNGENNKNAWMRNQDGEIACIDSIVTELIPAFDGGRIVSDPRQAIAQAVAAWLLRTPSEHTRKAYRHDLGQFLAFSGVADGHWETLMQLRPEHVAAWRDQLAAEGRANSSIRRKLTALRSLFSYLQTYGYLGANPAHGKFVAAPVVPRDGKTVGLSPADCRRLLDAPEETPAGLRDRAMIGVLAYSGCRVGELCRLRVKDYRQSGEHRVLCIQGKGGKERTTPLHLDAVERLASWIEAGGISEERDGPLFRPAVSPRGQGRDGFTRKAMGVRAVEKLIGRYVAALRLDPAVTVHSLRVTALTTARERGSDIIDLQDFAGHADPRTTLSYIRARDRLSNSPAYALRY
jgi:integrase/recombinase XerD